MKTWQLQDAKARLSEVITDAIEQGPQEITLRKKPAVVVLSIKDYEKLIKPKPSLVDFMNSSPLKGIDLKFERDQSTGRKVKL